MNVSNWWQGGNYLYKGETAIYVQWSDFWKFYFLILKRCFLSYSFILKNWYFKVLFHDINKKTLFVSFIFILKIWFDKFLFCTRNDTLVVFWTLSNICSHWPIKECICYAGFKYICPCLQCLCCQIYKICPILWMLSMEWNITPFVLFYPTFKWTL